MNTPEEYLEYYRANHRTLGCKITHLIGIPMIAIAIPLAFFNWRHAVSLFVAGWAFQFAGHLFFERNRPLFLSNPKNPYAYLMALVFVGQEWLHLLDGKRQDSADHPRLAGKNDAVVDGQDELDFEAGEHHEL